MTVYRQNPPWNLGCLNSHLLNGTWNRFWPPFPRVQEGGTGSSLKTFMPSKSCAPQAARVPAGKQGEEPEQRECQGGLRVPALFLHLIHLAGLIAAAGWPGPGPETRCRREESSQLAEQRPKSCEQLVGSGWVPSACSEPGWGRQAIFPPVHQGCKPGMTDSI